MAIPTDITPTSAAWTQAMEAYLKSKQVGAIVNGRGGMVYHTMFPLYDSVGKCTVAMPDFRVIKTFTCEVRWPRDLAELATIQYSPRTDTYELGKDDEAFVMAGQICHITAELTKRHVAALSATSTCEYRDNWKPRVNEGRLVLQRLFTIECKVDFRDEDKLPLFEQITAQAARHIYAQSMLLGDGVRPEIVIHAHDFFRGHADIAMFDDKVLSGEVAVAEAAEQKSIATTVPVDRRADEERAEELMKALHE